MVDVAYVLDGVTLHATVAGRGPTILLLHAGGERRAVWAPVAASLTVRGWRTVAVDQRGHGDSSGPATSSSAFAGDVIEMVRREPAPSIVVGASLGGVAALTALADPDTACRLAGVVLVDVVPDPDPRRVGPFLDGLAPGLRARFAELIEDIRVTGPERLATTAASDVPILLVHAEHSPVGDEDVARLRDARPDVAVTRIAGVGHLVARDAPAVLAQVVATHADAWLGAHG